jgi:hypothetical protein
MNEGTRDRMCQMVYTVYIVVVTNRKGVVHGISPFLQEVESSPAVASLC